MDAPGEAYKDPAFGIQITGGSSSIHNSFTQYRELGARARSMLVEAAARAWQVEAATVRTDAGWLIAADGRSAGYGERSEAAMALPVPASVTLKQSGELRLIGQPANRFDAADKSTGRQTFGMDMSRPGMKTEGCNFGPVVCQRLLGLGERQTGWMGVLRLQTSRNSFPCDIGRKTKTATPKASQNDNTLPTPRRREKCGLTSTDGSSAPPQGRPCWY